mgnify:FL=1
MAHWSLVTYTRPNTDTAWFEPSAEVLALIDTYKNDDLVNPTIETYEKIESADKLKQYYKISFKDEESSELLGDNSVYSDNIKARNSYCMSNDISCVIEQFGDVEPVIS